LIIFDNDILFSFAYVTLFRLECCYYIYSHNKALNVLSILSSLMLLLLCPYMKKNVQGVVKILRMLEKQTDPNSISLKFTILIQ